MRERDEESTDDRFASAAVLLSEWLDRRSAGSTETLESFTERHAELRTEIQALARDVAGLDREMLRSRESFAAIRARMEGLVESLRLEGTSRYVVEGEIGRGGMGAVYRVLDKKLDRTLAYKVILGQDAYQSTGKTPAVAHLQLVRFLNEARITGQLDHPGIVPVHEVGVDERGRVFFTMKLVKGRTLAEIFACHARGDAAPTRNQILRIMTRVCDAVGFAHQRDIVHRDLKPSNVMVGDFGEVYVMDWGLAQKRGAPLQPEADGEPSGAEAVPSSDPAAGPRTGWTALGDVVGTPSYMSPEQASVAKEDVGPWSDVYSIGAMLYELCSGCRPYAQEGASTPNDRILARLRGGPPQPLDATTAPADLAAIVNKAMARTGAQRYANAQDLGADLNRYLEGRVVLAHDSGGWATLMKWVLRNRGIAASVIAAALVLIGSSVVSYRYKVESDRNATELQNQLRQTQDLNTELGHERERADAEAENAKTNAELARQNEETALVSQSAASDALEDVLSLSAESRVIELVTLADTLWPVTEDMIPRYRNWIAQAQKLLQCADCPPTGRAATGDVPQRMLERLVNLRDRATPLSAADLEDARRSSRWFQTLSYERTELLWRRRMLGYEPWPDLDTNSFRWTDAERASTPLRVLGLSHTPLDPNFAHWTSHRTNTDEALFYSSKAVDMAPPGDSSLLRLVYADSLTARAQFDEARAQLQKAWEEASDFDRQTIRIVQVNLLAEIDRWTTPEGLTQERAKTEEVSRRVTKLQALVDDIQPANGLEGRESWWHSKLQILVRAMREFSLDMPGNSGLLSRGTSGDHGWGILRRLEFAETIRERSIEGDDAAGRWAAARADIAQSKTYAGCRWPSGGTLAPQIGLLPIGKDPRSGLWEFWHVQSGSEPRRDADGKLVLEEDSGIVLVLLPGGSTTLGAQKSDPGGPNYDPAAEPDEAIHEVDLPPYFLSKYEMTQAQWNMFCGNNPSDNRVGQFISIHEVITGLNPVEYITRDQAARMMKWMGLDLPSEDQWEYGIRAGTDTPWFTGADASDLRGISNLADKSYMEHEGAPRANIEWPDFDDGHVVHMPVVLTAPNGFGLMGMHDNVGEWTRNSYVTPSRAGEEVPQVWRGGSFYSTARMARSAKRLRSNTGNRYMNLGVRPCREVQP